MASTRLSKTLGTPTDNKKWTWSAWIKRSKSFNVVQRIFYAINSSNYTTLQFDDESNLIFFNEINGVGTDMQLKTSQVFRDAGAWYNIVIAYDSANSTAADRQIIYINGVRVTSFAIENTATINANTAINQAVPHTVGSSDGGGNYFEGLMSYTAFVDGTAYPATSFGEVNAASGIWKINTAPSVTYGNNGFFLKMDTTSPGSDTSGNDNTFTAAGTPTLAQDNASNNLATLNPLLDVNAVPTFLNGNTTIVGSSSGGARLSGSSISVGDFATFIAAPDDFIQMTSWDAGDWKGEIKIGDYVLISPGVRMMAALKISIDDSCMFGHGACITDADWHGIYDRTKVVGEPKPVILEKNVWVGEDAMICKGVTVGENSIIGARSVVTKDVPPNCIYAGNPAAFIRNLDEDEFITREDFFKDPIKLAKDFDLLDRYTLGNNTLWSWIKSIIWRNKTH